MKKLCILNFGCAAHEEGFRQIVENLRDEYELTSYPTNADLIIEYFCFIGDRKLRNITLEINYVNSIKKPDATYIIAGCLVSVVGEEKIKKYADYAFPRETWVQDVIKLIKHRKPEFKFFTDDRPYKFGIDIVGGCVRKGGYCTFCKQNYMHIPVKSMPMDEVLRIATEVTKDSTISTIVLDGLNTCNYGIDEEDHKQKLHILIRKLSEIPTVKWIDVFCLTVGDMYEELIDEIANNPKVCQIMLGIQSGSDKMLEIMNIHSTTAQIQYCLDRFSHKRIISIAVISHPGETLETVNETIAFIKKNNLWYLQAEGFHYSKCTPSAKMEQLPETKYKNYLSLVKDSIQELAQNFVNGIMNTYIDAYFAHVAYNVKKDCMLINVIAIKYHVYMSMTVQNASTTKYYEMLKNLPQGTLVKCRVSKFCQIDPPYIFIDFDEMEVI